MLAAILASATALSLAADTKPVLQKASGFVTAGGEGARFKRVPQKTFTIADRIFLVTMVTWQPVDKCAGRHRVTWRWYSKGTLISEIKQRHNCNPTPFEMRATIPAAALGIGTHKAEVLIDDEVLDAQGSASWSSHKKCLKAIQLARP